MIDVTVGDNHQGPNDEYPEAEIKESENSPADLAQSIEEISENRLKIRAITIFSTALVLYIFFSMLCVNQKYVDFGDGNYLYLSWRLAEGDVLYKDLPSPQPPLLLFLGAFWMKLLGGDPTLVRLWQILQHALTACCIWGIAARLFGRPIFSAIAGSIYLFLPEGVWWAAGYQSEPLLILLQCFNVMLFLTAVEQDRPTWPLYASAIVSALCCYVNMTAAPYVALQWFFVGFRFRRFFIRYSLSLVIPGALIFTGMWFYSEGQYIEHVFFRQVGTYPASSFLDTIFYFISKLYAEGGDILFYEGSFLFASIAGLFLYYSQDDHTHAEEYAFWWALFALGSIVFVTKGGTVEYIFTLGEPAVAIFSAFFLVTLFAATGLSFNLRTFKSPIELGKIVLLVCFFLPVLLMKPASLIYRTFSNGPLVIGSYLEERGVYELSGKEMEEVSMFVQRYCPPGKTLIAPPYYAFLSKRKLAENSSSLFILAHAYCTEWDRFIKTHDVPFDLPGLTGIKSTIEIPVKITEKTMRRYRRQFEYDTEGTFYNTQSVYDLAAMFNNHPALKREFPVINLFLNLRQQIIDKEVGLVVKNMHHFFFSIPPLHQAIRDYCQPIQPQLQLENREEEIVFYEVKP